MPDIYVIKTSTPQETEKTAKLIEQFEHVYKVNYGAGTIEKLFDVTNMIRNIGFIFIVGLAFTAMLLISNTIKITIIARSNEIEIMKLVGGTNSFIRWPFFIEGLLLGVVGAIIPIAILVFGYQQLLNSIGNDLKFNIIMLLPMDPEIKIGEEYYLRQRLSHFSKFFYNVGVFLLAGILLLDLGINEGVQANTLNIQNLNKEIQELGQRRKQQEELQKNIDAQINKLGQQKQKAQEEIATINKNMEVTENQFLKKEEEIEKTKQKVQQTEKEIKETERKIEARDELLKTRVRQMYEAGRRISYLEVLLGSSSFGQFLERLDFIVLIFQQDQKILNDFIASKEEIQEKIIEINQLLVTLEEQLNELNTLQKQLTDQSKARSLRIASLEEEQEELIGLDEQIQEEVLQLVNEVADKRSQLIRHQEEIERLKREKEQQAQKQNRQQQTTNQTEYNGTFTWPVPSSTRITSPFGLRIHPITGRQEGHSGIDIGARVPGTTGDDIVAAEDGIVIVAEYLRGYGNTVVIDHGGNIRTLYAHIRNGGIKVEVGDSVNKGQKIAEIGSTGNSTGPHLHFEVHKNGKQVDPMSYLN